MPAKTPQPLAPGWFPQTEHLVLSAKKPRDGFLHLCSNLGQHRAEESRRRAKCCRARSYTMDLQRMQTEHRPSALSLKIKLEPTWALLQEKGKQEISGSPYSCHRHLRHLLLENFMALMVPEPGLGSFQVTTLLHCPREKSSAHTAPSPHKLLLNAAILRPYQYRVL